MLIPQRGPSLSAQCPGSRWASFLRGRPPARSQSLPSDPLAYSDAPSLRRPGPSGLLSYPAGPYACLPALLCPLSAGSKGASPPELLFGVSVPCPALRILPCSKPRLQLLPSTANRMFSPYSSKGLVSWLCSHVATGPRAQAPGRQPSERAQRSACSSHVQHVVIRFCNQNALNLPRPSGRLLGPVRQVRSLVEPCCLSQRDPPVGTWAV